MLTLLTEFTLAGDFVKGHGLAILGQMLDRGVKIALMYGDRDYQCNCTSTRVSCPGVNTNHDHCLQGSAAKQSVLPSIPAFPRTSKRQDMPTSTLTHRMWEAWYANMATCRSRESTMRDIPVCEDLQAGCKSLLLLHELQLLMRYSSVPVSYTHLTLPTKRIV